MRKILFFVLGVVCPFLLGAQIRTAYSHTGKISFTVSSEKILVEFKAADKGRKPAIIQKNRYATLFESLKEGEQRPTAVLKLKQAASPALVNDMIQEFKKDTNVVWAGQFLLYQDSTLQGISNRILVKLKEGTDLATFNALLKQQQLVIIDKNATQDRVYTLQVMKQQDKDALDIANLLYESGKFEYAEVDFLRLLKKHTSDPLYNYQWALNNTGSALQYSGTAGADVKATQAWCHSTGANIKVAVIDEGVDLNHPDLTGNFVTGYDATGNGSAGAPSGDDAHGTNCAGIIAAKANNNIGVAGLAYNAKIMPVRIAYGDGYGYWVTFDSWIANGITWAYTNGADILSNSWGGGSPSSAITNAFSASYSLGRGKKGCIVLISSGNSNGAVAYPANLSTSQYNVIAVGASSMCDSRKRSSGDPQGVSCDGEYWWGSNYGNELDVVAPGVKIASTDISGAAGYSTGDYYETFNGTSSACPYAAAAMALILSVNPDLPAYNAKSILLSTADKIAGYTYSAVSGRDNGTWNNEVGHGRINAYNAVKKALTSYIKITGIDTYCKKATYTISNVPAGSVVSWSATGTVTVAGSTGNTVNVTTTGYGTGNVVATITSGCDVLTVSKALNTGGITMIPAVFTIDKSDNCAGYYYHHIVIEPYPEEVSYYWDISGPVSGNVTTATNQADIRFLSAGWYYINVKISNTCGEVWLDPWEEFEAVNCGLRLPAPANASSNLLYPNPANAELVVTSVDETATKGQEATAITEVRLLDDRGQVMVQQKNASNSKQIRIDTRKLRSGIYYLHILRGTAISKEKVIIQH